MSDFSFFGDAPNTHEGMRLGIHVIIPFMKLQRLKHFKKIKNVFFQKFPFFGGRKHSTALTDKPLKVRQRSIWPSLRRMGIQTHWQANISLIVCLLGLRVNSGCCGFSLVIKKDSLRDNWLQYITLRIQTKAYLDESASRRATPHWCNAGPIQTSNPYGIMTFPFSWEGMRCNILGRDERKRLKATGVGYMDSEVGEIPTG